MKTEEIIKVCQAYADGKTIEYYDNSTEEWYETNRPSWNFSSVQYRVKEEPIYREYKNIEEFLEASKEHGPYLKRKCINSSYDTYVLPVSFRGNWIDFNKAVDNDGCSETEITLYALSHNYTWQDGTPCGKIL